MASLAAGHSWVTAAGYQKVHFRAELWYYTTHSSPSLCTHTMFNQ